MIEAASLPIFYGISAAALCGSVEAFLKRLDAALQHADLQLVQVRDKGLEDADRERLAHACVQRCRAHGAKVLISDDEELARRVEADGIHVSSTRLGAGLASDWEIVGASVHNQAEADLACSELDADFLVLSPVLATLTHVDAQPLGWESFGEIAAACAPRPVYALGGLEPSDLDIARMHGAHGIAAMRSLWSLPHTRWG